MNVLLVVMMLPLDWRNAVIIWTETGGEDRDKNSKAEKHSSHSQEAAK